nr:uncharacterized protein LOC116770449 isoform X2 [Danaus plexippus plexippus]
MSDQEKKGVSSAIGSSVVMVEQTTDGRHKQPYRPTELQDDNEMYQKRSKAPVVPSVAEELKHINEESANAIAEKRERKECEAMSSEKHKHAKKLSSNTKRRESSPESIAMSAIDVDKKRMLPPSQPIPLDVDTALSGAHDLTVEKNAPRKPDEDSITEEIAELRTPELEKKHSNWKTNSPKAKREISWEDKEYQDNVILKEMIARSEIWMLDRKASVGPCYRPGMPFEGPSGITICLPKKSLKTISQPSGISINISKKCIVNKDKKSEAAVQCKNFFFVSGQLRMFLQQISH